MMGVALEEDKIREHSLVKGHPWAGRGVGKKPRKKEKKKKHVCAVPRGAKNFSKARRFEIEDQCLFCQSWKIWKDQGKVEWWW